MDGHQFDDLTRRMATGTSRRQALRLGSGGLVAGLLTLAGLRDVAADDTPEPLGKKCRKDAQCATGYCDPETATCAAPPATSPTGELTSSDPTFFLCGSTFLRYYDTYAYSHGGGPLTIGLRGADTGGGTLHDPLLLLYHSFYPSAACANFVAVNDDDGCGQDSYLSMADLPAGTYTVVVTSFYDTTHSNATGSYTLEFNTPPPVC